MEQIYIPQFARQSVILQYTPKTGVHKEVQLKKSGIKAKDLTPGFYTRVGENVYGVYRSSEGPCFFANKERIALADKAVKAKIAAKTKSNKFTLVKQGKSVFEIDYPRVPLMEYGFDNWTQDEADADFFMWLSNQMNEQEDQFNKYYTSQPQVKIAVEHAKSRAAARTTRVATRSAKPRSKSQSRR